MKYIDEFSEKKSKYILTLHINSDRIVGEIVNICNIKKKGGDNKCLIYL